MYKMKIYYKDKFLNKNNIFLSPQQSSTKPIIKLGTTEDKIYTLVMFDPDAVGGNKIHWLIINITGINISDGLTIIKYKGPAPPIGSGKHHYVICLLEQTNPIPLVNLGFRSRFIELKELFKKLNFNLSIKFKIYDIRYFVSENI